MKITNEEIASKSGPTGAFKKVVLAEWGVPWPPPKGWRYSLLLHGVPYQPLTASEQSDFESEKAVRNETYREQWYRDNGFAWKDRT